MSDPVRKSASQESTPQVSDESGASGGASSSAAVPGTGSAAEIGAAFPEAATEAIAALLHLIKLMGGELVLNVAGGETERFERAVRSKIEQYTSPTSNPASRKAGLAFAAHLVEQVLTQLRAQAEVKRSLTKTQPRHQEPQGDSVGATPSPSKFLN